MVVNLGKPNIKMPVGCWGRLGHTLILSIKGNAALPVSYPFARCTQRGRRFRALPQPTLSKPFQRTAIDHPQLIHMVTTGSS